MNKIYKPEYIKYLDLPKIPSNLLSDLPKNFDLYVKHFHQGPFSRSDSFRENIDQWCKKHISKQIDFGFQIIDSDIPTHIDNRVLVKFFYLIDPGGNNVVTKFWSADQKEVLEEYLIPPDQWLIFKADTPHSVENIEPGKNRFSIVGKIF